MARHQADSHPRGWQATKLDWLSYSWPAMVKDGERLTAAGNGHEYAMIMVAKHLLMMVNGCVNPDYGWSTMLKMMVDVGWWPDRDGQP